MDGHIRYGSEVDVYRAIDQTSPKNLDLLKDFSGRILSFSPTVSHIPGEPGFEILLAELGMAYFSDAQKTGQNHQYDSKLLGIRVIEIIDSPPANYEMTKKLGDGLVRLAVESGRLGPGGVMFFDHTAAAKGTIISAYNTDTQTAQA